MFGAKEGKRGRGQRGRGQRGQRGRGQRGGGGGGFLPDLNCFCFEIVNKK